MQLKHVLVGLTLMAANIIFAQNKEGILLTIEGNNITSGEFMAIYNKNNVDIESADKKSIAEYLELYINFKLKVHEAEVQGYDTASSFNSELDGYVSQLAAPYLVDNDFTEDLISEAYDRSKVEIRASHIMVKLPKNPSPEDTAAAWALVNSIYQKALLDSSFQDLAMRYSEDPSAAQNQGDLGYFTSFRMVYPFESAAFNTPVGSVAKPVRTTFGYHVIQVTDRRPARGEIKAAHIMVISNEKSTEEEVLNAQKKMEEIYAELLAGASFSKLANTYSDDRGSAQKGGDLGWFGAGKMVPIFEENTFALTKNGMYSKPFLSKFGWHIVKRLDKKEIGTYEEEYEGLKKKVKKDGRSRGSEHALVVKLMAEYKVKIKESTKTAFYEVIDSTYFTGNWDRAKADGLNATMFSLKDKVYGRTKMTYTQADFANFLAQRMRSKTAISIPMLIDQEFDKFVDAQILAYERSVLAYKYPAYKALVTEYHDGILLFEIMEDEVWKKAMSDTTGLEAFYNSHSGDYMWGERVDASLFICQTLEISDQVFALVNAHTSDSVILSTVNEESQLALNIRNGKFEKGQESILDEVNWKEGTTQITTDGDFVIVKINTLVLPEPKLLKEIKGIVTSAYQDELDRQWIELLKSTYTYSINQEVLDALGK